MHFAKRFTTKIAAGLLVTSTLITPAFAATGTVNAILGLNLRSAANTTSSVLAALGNGTKVEVSGAAENGWYKVTYQNKTGYVSSEYLVVDDGTAQTAAATYVRVTAGPLNVRNAPSTSGAKVRQLSVGTVVQVTGLENGWYKLSDGNYICGDYVIAADASSSTGAQIAAYAQKFLGYRYVYGGASPSGFDCSGFVWYVYRQFGVTLNRGASSQMSNGTSVSRSNLQPGDLVFFKDGGSGVASHVGLYIGNGQIIHASTPTRGVVIDSLNSSYYSSHFVGARRIF